MRHLCSKIKHIHYGALIFKKHLLTLETKDAHLWEEATFCTSRVFRVENSSNGKTLEEKNI